MKLSDICDYATDRTNISALNKSNYISTENMLPNKSGITLAATLPTTTQIPAYKIDDVLVSNIRPYFKKIWKANFDGGCSADVLVFRAKENVDSDFLYYVLSSDKFFEYSMATSKGTKMPRGDKKSIMEFEVPNFDFPTQKKIVEVLSCLDAKIELNRRINENLEQQAGAIFKEWFVDKAKAEWKVGCIGDIIELHDKKRIPLSSRERENMEKVYPYYGATSVLDYVNDYIFDGIYLLLGEDGTVIDDKGFPILQYVEGKFWCNNHAHIISGKNGFSVEILYILFSLTNVKSIVTGAVQQKISQENLKKVPVAMPNKKKLKEFDNLIQPMFSEIRNLRKENEILAQIRDTLLPKLMSGEIEI